MAAKSTTEQTPTVSAANKLTTYDLAIGILAIFSLFILVVPFSYRYNPRQKILKHLRK